MNCTESSGVSRTGGLLAEHDVGSIEQALMVVKSPRNTECYKKRWVPATREFSFCYEASLEKILKKLQNHGF